MALSAIGMSVAAAGWLTPVAGAVVQEVIDVLAVLNALRMTRLPAAEQAADLLEQLSCADRAEAA